MNRFNYSYFSGANTSIVINNEWIDCAGISYKLLSSKQPIYSHYSPVYDILSTARQIIQGNFVLNYTKADYLLDIINGPQYAKINKQISSNWPKRDKSSSEEYVFNTYYLQYNNTMSFDIYIDFGKSNFTVLKDCRITTRAQSINIDDEVLLEEFSFIAREIKIAQSPDVKNKDLISIQNNTQKITPNTLEEAVKQEVKAPTTQNNTASINQIPSNQTQNAVTENLNETKTDPKTTQTTKTVQVAANNGTQIPAKKLVETRTTKTQLDGSRSQSIELIRENVFAMQKIIDDAKKLYPDETYDATTKEKRSKYIFDEFKRMTGGIPPSSRYIPDDMNNTEQLKNYYNDGAEFVETLATNAASIKKLTFDDFDPNSNNNVLTSFHNVKEWKKNKAIRQGDYYAALNTLLLTSRVMLPVSTGELAYIAKWSNDTKKQADDEKIKTMTFYDDQKAQNFKDSYNDLNWKDKLSMPFGWSPNLDYITSDNNGSSLGGSNLISSESSNDIELLKRRFSSDTLSIGTITKDVTKENIEQWNKNKNNINADIKNPIGPAYYQFNNFYDSVSHFGNKIFKDRNALSEQEKNIVNSDWPFSLPLNNYLGYLNNPLDLFNGVSYYSENQKGVYFQNFLDFETTDNLLKKFEILKPYN